MSEKKVPNACKLAMSRALGAAFLNHQVEQLEKTVSNNGPASGNWRDRRQAHERTYSPGSPGATATKRGPNPVAQRKKGGETPVDRTTNISPTARKRSGEEERKDADVVVVDASVLVNALYQVKKWCRDGREEIVIVPLEALNTLDLLKKGTTALAQRARAASRILEAQVGTNPRIRVQRDDAFVLWDKIGFQDTTSSSGSPEWVRRTICCARWELDHADEELKNDPTRKSIPHPKVVLAVLASSLNLSPQTVPLKLADGSESPLTPVPLPAPVLPASHKHEPRSAGVLVSQWAAKAGITVLPIEPTLPGRGAEDDDRPKRPHGRGRRPSATDYNGPSGQKVGLVERPPAVMAMMEMVAQPSKVVRVLARGEKLDPDP